ncbi:MAG: hypothetical protein RL026_2501 [Pseudomonadota bacterium]
MRRALLAAVLALGSVLPAAQAHHSFAMFDREREVTLQGVVKEFQWTNPHSWIQLTVKDAQGREVEWSLEGGSPGVLSRGGWKRTSLQPGDVVKVVIYPLKDGTPGGAFLEVTKADGSTLYYHG